MHRVRIYTKNSICITMYYKWDDEDTRLIKEYAKSKEHNDFHARPRSHRRRYRSIALS